MTHVGVPDTPGEDPTGIVILHHRNWPGVRDTITDALVGAETSAAWVLVVDNASQDGSLEQIRTAFPRVEVLARSTNDGYAGGMNAGLQALIERGVTRALLLTHEVRLAPETVDVLLDRLMASPGLGAAGPVLRRSSTGEIWSAGGRLDGWGRASHSLSPGGAPAWLDGAVLAVRPQTVLAVGGFDPGYFLYWEDVDLCTRLWQAGHPVELLAEAVAYQETRLTPPYLVARGWMRHALQRCRGRQRVQAVTGLAARVLGRVLRHDLVGARLMLAGALDAGRGRIDRELAIRRPD